MKIGIMQPYFFPYIGYWQLINEVDEYVIFDDVNYIKRGYINRNTIMMNGRIQRINLKIKDASQNRLIKDTKIAQTKEDVDSLLMTIRQAYSKAPCFASAYKLLERILYYETGDLTEYLSYQIRCVCDYLGIETKILRSSQIEKREGLKGEEKIIDICCCRGADYYINAIGGKELYHQSRFKEHGIELSFLRTNNLSYKQSHEGFTPNLSIVDVMMFNGEGDIKRLLNSYTLEK